MRLPRPNLDPRRLDDWGVRRRVGGVAVLVALLLGLLAAWPTMHNWLRATAFTADAVFRLPVRPLTWVTADPSTERLDYAAGGFGLLTLPSGDKPAPGLVIVLGADAAKPDDARVVRLTDSLARIGFAVLLTQSDELDAALVLPIEAERLVGAFEALRAHPRVRPDAIGYFGLSAGGSLVMVAAADPRIAADVAYVVALGPYYDAAALVAAVMSHSFRTPEGIVPWSRRRSRRVRSARSCCTTCPRPTAPPSSPSRRTTRPRARPAAPSPPSSNAPPSSRPRRCCSSSTPSKTQRSRASARASPSTAWRRRFTCCTTATTNSCRGPSPRRSPPRTSPRSTTASTSSSTWTRSPATCATCSATAGGCCACSCASSTRRTDRQTSRGRGSATVTP